MTTKLISSLCSNLARATFSFVLLLIAVACVRPAAFGFGQIGLDWSWMAAVSYAVQKHFVFGSEIVFTSGPLSSFYHRMYPHDLAPTIIALDIIWTAAFTLELQKMFDSLFASNARRLLFALFLVFLILLAERLFRDGLMFFFVFGSVYLYSCRKVGTLFLIASIAVTAAFCMAKFSMNAFALPAFVIVDLLSVSRREVPYKTAMFLLCSVGFFVAAGQPLSGLPGYLQASLEVSSGYAAGMSIDGSLVDLLLWSATALTVVCIASFAAWPAIKSNGSDRWTSGVQLLLLVVYVFVLMKAGFIRHDAHSLIAWTGLFLAVPLVATAICVRWKYDPFLGPLVVCFVYLYLPNLKQPQWNSLNPAAIAERSIASIQAVAEFAAQPRRWMADKELRFKAAQERVRLAAHLPELPGSVDIIPSRQSEVIATGLDYRPRPTVQEYTTYSQKLIERNRAFYRSAKAPDYVLFAPGSIDGRHPASAEGPLWPLFLQLYEPVESRYDLVVLRKRHQPLAELLKEPVLRQAKLGERIVVPPTAAPMFVKIDIKYNLLGRIAVLLFKLPNVTLRAIYDDSMAEDYRLIPDIAREGSVLVPTIKIPITFLQLYIGGAAAYKLPRPVAFEVVTGRFAALAYQSKFSISFAEIDKDVLANVGDRLSEANLNGGSRSGLDTIVASAQFAPPLLEPSAEGIFAHAPSQLPMDVGGADSIDLGFGIRDGAWQEGALKGICFSVLGEGARPLFSRCLNPRTVVSDRGPQSAHVSIPAGTGQIKLSTTCVEVCDWAWSYWSKANLAPASR